MKYTIKDVAEKAGVSIATVSRVINGSSQVSDRIKNRVMQIIAEMDFKPSPVARSLVLKKTRSIGVIVPDISNAFIGEILNGIEEISQSFQYDVMVCSTRGNYEQEIRYLEMFESKQVEGIIFMSWKLQAEVVDKINSIQIPVIMINRNTSKLEVPSVSIDNYKAAYQMTNYLITKGHKKIAFIRNSIDIDAVGLDQYRGFKQALNDNGMDVDKNFIKYGHFSIENSYQIVQSFINDKNLPTAIFATSDVMAVGAVNALKDNGFDVPQDISVVGFNDVKLASIYRPKLTVIHQPLYAIGTVAVKMIINRASYEQSLEGRIVLLPHRLIERESCGDAPSEQRETYIKTLLNDGEEELDEI